MSFTFDLPDGSMWPFIFFAFAAIVLVFWIKTLIEISQHEFSGHAKIAWLGFVFFAPLLGMIAYYIFGRNQIIGQSRNSEGEYV